MIPVQFQTSESPSNKNSAIDASIRSDQLEKGLASAPVSEHSSKQSSVSSSSPSIAIQQQSTSSLLTTTDDDECDRSSQHVRPWTHAWFHITVSVLSAPAAASLPYAFAYLTWSGAILLLLYATITSYVSGSFLIHLQQPHMKTYSDVADGAMQTPGFANRYVRPFQALVFVQVSIWTILVTGQAMTNLNAELSPPTGEEGESQLLSETWWVVVSGVLYFVIAMIPSLDQMWSLSVIGSVCGILACVLLVTGSILAMLNGSRTDIDFGRPAGGTDLTYAFGILASFGTIALT